MSRSLRAARAASNDAAGVFAALGDQTRLRVLERLSSYGPQSITRLAEGEIVTRQAITKHLITLASVGLVRHHRSGRERIWELNPDRLAEARLCLNELSAQWDTAIARLTSYVEE